LLRISVNKRGEAYSPWLAVSRIAEKKEMICIHQCATGAKAMSIS